VTVVIGEFTVVSLILVIGVVYCSDCDSGDRWSLIYLLWQW